MAIPPLPPQELAKLVLGYLAEERLMTAYDEFLQASPHLDAQKNEYDRIWMQSLRSILSEYRAVRIYVEGCKPIALREKLYQCANLVEKVKFLVHHIDISKLQTEVSQERVRGLARCLTVQWLDSIGNATKLIINYDELNKTSIEAIREIQQHQNFESQDISTSKSACDAFNSPRQGNSVYSNRKRNVSLSKSVSNTESIHTVEKLTQTTPLSDLPGNQDNVDNKFSRFPERDTSTTQSRNNEIVAVGSPCKNSVNFEHNSINASLYTQSNTDNVMSSSTVHKLNIPGNGTSLQCSQSQNIAEFNTVLNQVYNNSMVTGRMRDNNNMICNENILKSKIATTGTFQDFTTGVGGVTKTNINVPDSSTSETVNVQIPPTIKETKTHNKRGVKVPQKKKCVYRVGNLKHDVTEISSEIIDVDSIDLSPQSKTDEQKVTILSDVRLGKDDRCVRLAPAPKNATSTPLLQTQTIFINGTPVYQQKKPEQNITYTRDEIMAMPTLFIVQSGPSQTTSTTTNVTNAQPESTTAQSSSITTSICSIPKAYQPLNVDVSHNLSNAVNYIPDIHDVQGAQCLSKSGLVKTVDSKIASVPKDSIVASSGTTSTPHILPPKRKSLSTPRRTSHVRVLDFTTPRRILDEAIDENPNPEGELDSSEDVIINKTVIAPNPLGAVPDKSRDHIIEVKTTDSSKVNLKEDIKNNPKKSEVRKRADWDADLRALAVSNDAATNIRLSASKPKHKRAKKVVEDKDPDKHITKAKKKTDVKNNVTSNVKTSKKKVKQTEETKLEGNDATPELPVIVGANFTEKVLSNIKDKEPDKASVESKGEEQIDTPEVERLSLHNEIGVKLNISDILETPYKQALYDIQMETPRFLGPDLPDDPISDIKIMNIPTPRFLSSNVSFTPKPAQATPSSYSSRPTDYSSGGSYYKPDDQECLLFLEDVSCVVTSSLSKENTKSTEDNAKLEGKKPKEKSRKTRSSRPIRQCTKNVSYYNSPINKNSITDKKDDVSSCTDSVSPNSSFENTTTESVVAANNEKTKSSSKVPNKNNLSLTKKHSPLKKVTQKSFMKIKPKRSTSTKDFAKNTDKKSTVTMKNTSVGKRNRTSLKNKADSVTSFVPAPTKSRRKSSTPRKLHCTKTFNSESSGHESPEVGTKEIIEKQIPSSSVSCIQDSDTDQPPLRWSDDGSQDTKQQNTPTGSVPNDTDEISQIKEYIDKTLTTSMHEENKGSLHIDLIKRGFDAETAKIIERDLLNTPSHCDKIASVQLSIDKTPNKLLERSVESDCSTLTSNLVINEEDDNDDIEFSVNECNEESDNYLTVQYIETNKSPKNDLPMLKDKYSMEVCVNDDFLVRLRATPITYLLSYEPNETNDYTDTNNETELAVSSISNMDRLYTPLKDPIRAQCYEIFDSTLTSIDTPLKSNSPGRQQEYKDSEVVIQVEHLDEKLEVIEKTESRRRKRSHCSSTSEESVNCSKKVKPEPQYHMLHSKEIKNLDIETVLSRLHGP